MSGLTTWIYGDPNAVTASALFGELPTHMVNWSNCATALQHTPEERWCDGLVEQAIRSPAGIAEFPLGTPR